MKRLLKRLSLQWRITLLTILLLATACVTMKTLLCSSGHAYMDSIGNYVMHYVQEDPQAIRVDIPDEQWKDLSERFNGEFVLELSGAKHSFCIRGWYIALAVTALIVCGIVYLMTKNGFVSLILAAVLEAGLIGGYLWDSSRFEGLFPQIISQLSLFARFYTIVNGVFDMTAIVYYLSVTGFFLFLSVQSLEKRRWSE